MGEGLEREGLEGFVLALLYIQHISSVIWNYIVNYDKLQHFADCPKMGFFAHFL